MKVLKQWLLGLLLSTGILYCEMVSFIEGSYSPNALMGLIESKQDTTFNSENMRAFEEAIAPILDSIKQNRDVPFDIDQYNKHYSQLRNRMNINTKYDNQLAIMRDELHKSVLLNDRLYAQTIQRIINGKTSYKDRHYFIDLLTQQIERLNEIDFKSYEKIHKAVRQSNDKVSQAFIANYNRLYLQTQTYLVLFKYLKNNLDTYREKHFFVDQFNTEFFIGFIDALPFVSYLTEIIEYYIHVTIGQIVVVFGMMIGLIILAKTLIPFLKEKIKQMLTRRYKKTGMALYEQFHESFSLPLRAFVYLLIVEYGLTFLLDAQAVTDVQPWFKTGYLAIFTFFLYSFLKNSIHFYADRLFITYPNVRKEMIDFLLRIGKMLIIIFVILFLLMELGFDIKAILASLGIGGIAVALAAKDTLSNFFGSLNIITDNSFSQGDWIAAEGLEGTVVDIRMRTTRIRTFANAMITVPNAQLANMAITNWSKRKVGRRIKFSVGITYESALKNIEQLVVDIRDMLLHHEGIASVQSDQSSTRQMPHLLKKEDLSGIKKTLLVYIDSYESSSINILVYCFSKSVNWEDWLKVKEDVLIKIHHLVEKNECAFAYPTQSIFLSKMETEDESVR